VVGPSVLVGFKVSPNRGGKGGRKPGKRGGRRKKKLPSYWMANPSPGGKKVQLKNFGSVRHGPGHTRMGKVRETTPPLRKSHHYSESCEKVTQSVR